MSIFVFFRCIVIEYVWSLFGNYWNNVVFIEEQTKEQIRVCIKIQLYSFICNLSRHWSFTMSIWNQIRQTWTDHSSDIIMTLCWSYNSQWFRLEAYTLWFFFINFFQNTRIPTDLQNISWGFYQHIQHCLTHYLL